LVVTETIGYDFGTAQEKQVTQDRDLDSARGLRQHRDGGRCDVPPQDQAVLNGHSERTPWSARSGADSRCHVCRFR
jgi:hypothetical protein